MKFSNKFFLNFRSRVQRTKETIGKEIGDANAMQMDANLFVGDIQGIKKAKTESKKIASSASGTHYLYVQGLSQSNSKNDNDQDENEDEVQILEPTEFKVSNRSGGIFFKKEVLSEHDEDDEDIFQDEILKVIQSEAAMKQDSSTELIAKSNNEPMKLNFAMPSTSANLNKNDAISDTSSSDDDDDDFEEVTTLKKNEVLEIGKVLEMISRKNFKCLSKVFCGLFLEFKPQPTSIDDDLFADVFGTDTEENEIKIEKKVEIIKNEPEPNDVTEISAQKMKQTDQLYLKIASKYMEPEHQNPGPSTQTVAEGM